MQNSIQPVYAPFGSQVKLLAAVRKENFCFECHNTGQIDDYQDCGESMIWAGCYDCPVCSEVIR